MDAKIKRLYLNPKYKGSFSGLHTFSKALGSKYNKVDILNTLRSIPAYTQNRPAPHRFKRRKVITHGIDDQFVIDLIDISKYSKQNNKKTFLLVIIDAFSKYAWVEGLRNKSSKEVTNAFKRILKKSKRFPSLIQVDKGNEFKGEFKRFCETQGYKIFHVQSELKACIVERFNRTLLEKISRYLLHNQDRKKNTQYRFIHVLKDIVSNYNNSYHRTIKMSPSKVNSDNEMDVWMTMYGKEDLKVKSPPRFKPGDRVLISIDKAQFTKGYDKKFHPEVFTVERFNDSNPRMYYLRDSENNLIEGGFYSCELSLVTYDNPV